MFDISRKESGMHIRRRRPVRDRFHLRAALALITCSVLTIVALMSGCGGAPKEGGVAHAGITARELVQPGALAGPGPTILSWSPEGAELAYAQKEGDTTKLWTVKPDGEKKLVLDPSGHPDNIDVTVAQWSPSGNSMLMAGDESLWIVDTTSGKLDRLATGGSKTSMTFSPNGAQVTFVKDNDIYLSGAGGGEVRRLTTDGSDSIYNGTLDWVYGEELATRAAQPGYAWSPDGARLFYLRLDDNKVQQHPVTDYKPVPPTTSYTRYPVAGTDNPVASLHVIDPRGGGPQAIAMPADSEYVLPLFSWTPDSREAIYMTVNRDHTVLQLNAWDPAAATNRVLIKETDPKWINEWLYAPPVFLPGGQRFLWLSERSGFLHLYEYTIQGQLEKQVTRGEWMIDASAYDIITPGRPVGLDPSGTWAYFSSTRGGPLDRELDRVNVASGAVQKISGGKGFASLALSADGAWFAQQTSDVRTPPITSIKRSDGSGEAVVAKCAPPDLDLPEVKREFVNVKAHDGVELKAQMVKPADFDPSRKYGVVVHWYCGPTLQMVSNRYGTTNVFNIIERDVLYTQAGFIVWRLDNRGSYGRGHAFETPIEGQLGPAALDDQVAGIEYLKKLDYVDGSNIGTDGKSFGGFMTLYGLIMKPDVIKCGVAGSGPTRWQYYDTIYTERYMRTPAANPGGYEKTDLVSRAGTIKAAPLIIHGLADTNVHLQNSVNFIQELEKSDKAFDFIPLPDCNHSYKGDALAAALSASLDYFSRKLR